MKRTVLTLIAGIWLMMTSLFSQAIPNAGFETWDKDTVSFMGPPVIFDYPTGWYPLTSLLYAMTGMGGIGLAPSTDAQSGSYSAMMEISGSLAGGDIFTSFPVSQLPLTLNGYYKYDGASVMEPAMISLLFTRYDPVLDSSVIVGEGTLELGNMATAFTPFSVPVQQTGVGNPDTCYIMISYLILPVQVPSVKTSRKFWIDNLSFQGVAGIQRNAIPEMKMMQDPASSTVSLTWKPEPGKLYFAELYSLTGKLIDRKDQLNGSVTFSTADLPSGLYILRLSDGRQVTARKFVR
ncbi:MAG: T9SS type A sorting domain-containing protein [Lentimicrobiaceae bacterium]|nr:T9SS type A sorting domain-containing protein [Lentimicrobiaceae bacterium]